MSEETKRPVLHEGGWYRLRNGWVIGPLRVNGDLFYPWPVANLYSLSWTKEGDYFPQSNPRCFFPLDIIAEVGKKAESQQRELTEANEKAERYRLVTLSQDADISELKQQVESLERELKISLSDTEQRGEYIRSLRQQIEGLTKERNKLASYHLRDAVEIIRQRDQALKERDELASALAEAEARQKYLNLKLTPLIKACEVIEGLAYRNKDFDGHAWQSRKDAERFMHENLFDLKQALSTPGSGLF